MARKYFDVKGVDYVVDGGSADSKPHVNIKMVVTRGAEAGETKWYRGYLTENAAEFTLKAMKALGWIGPELDNKEGFGSILATAVEDDDTWTTPDGEERTSRKVKFINEYKPRAMKAKNEAPKDFLKQFKALAKEIAGPEHRVPAPAVVEAPTPVETTDTSPDSDIPF